jgi:23S rRNA pseudouridine1911/1915/1917 synthase
LTADTFTIDGSLAGERLDKALAKLAPDLSRTRIQSIAGEGHISVNGRAEMAMSRKVASGDIVVIARPPAVDPAPKGEAIPLDVVFEDGDLIVIDKPAGLVVHPAGGHETGTLVNALIAHCGSSLSGIGGVRRPGIVHRLDKDTSGLLVAAKNDRTHKALSEQFADHGRTGPLDREYIAFVWGRPPVGNGTVATQLDRSTANREKMAVVGEGKGRHAITHYRVEGSYGGVCAKVICSLETGRTHQIRVHMAHLGCPVMGDDVYGSGFKTKARMLPEAARSALAALGRQALHAAVLQFKHPATGEVMRFESGPPQDIAALEQALSDANG